MGVRVAVAGASGYAGGELLRLISEHPDLELGPVTAGASVGAAVTDVHPHLADLASRTFEHADPVKTGSGALRPRTTTTGHPWPPLSITRSTSRSPARPAGYRTAGATSCTERRGVSHGDRVPGFLRAQARGRREPPAGPVPGHRFPGALRWAYPPGEPGLVGAEDQDRDRAVP